MISENSIKTDNDLRLFYSQYQKKNRKLLRSGYPLVPLFEFNEIKDRLFLVKDGEKLISSFAVSKEEMENKKVWMIAHFYIIDNTIIKRKKEEFLACIRRVIKDDYDLKIIIQIEDYLKAESLFLQDISAEFDHFTVRLINDLRDFQAEERNDINVNDEFSLRTFQIGKDEEMFMHIFNNTFKHLCSPITLQNVESWVHSDKFNPSCYIFAVKKKEVIGFIAIEVYSDKLDEGRFSYLQEIGVLDSFKDQGIGSRLLYAGISAAKKAGSNRMGVGVLGRNKSAFRFFQNNGFKEVYKKNYLKIII
ncbi:MAG: GNAT family N-acetyltransferase [Spirochaetes bacterium]|nr:GNAT family N-acetyltransferase [Spirochaetota bacterium]